MNLNFNQLYRREINVFNFLNPISVKKMIIFTFFFISSPVSKSSQSICFKLIVSVFFLNLLVLEKKCNYLYTNVQYNL